MKGEFRTLAGMAEAETRVRGSRFIAVAAPVREEAEARQLLESRAREYFDATHNCAAWRLRDGSWRALDAGEPSGSAGAPILAALDARTLQDAMVIVTRYFGGTKLGVGGLVRAYGDAAAAVLDSAPLQRGIFGVRARCRYPYAHTAAVMRALERFQAHAIAHGYAADEAETTFEIAAGAVGAMESAVRGDTGGDVRVDSLDPVVIYRPLSG